MDLVPHRGKRTEQVTPQGWEGRRKGGREGSVLLEGRWDSMQLPAVSKRLSTVPHMPLTQVDAANGTPGANTTGQS